ncbi:class I SAM-dependent methyltransferase [Pontivivens ytuae]|uniref:Class I SAM-dependent methyltransferase n=1 Tax=Pontivivens ytuae TaxID=2789856 RepID=A0A7S9LR12_9RHOB|nr:class I SAM-dependent methyltransferase [Pontivivens ytuae]QPH53524.1 class I SAM-dependent methyltransferase [Pontivivens ytuae]
MKAMQGLAMTGSPPKLDGPNRAYRDAVGDMKVVEEDGARRVLYEDETGFRYDLYREVQNLGNAAKLNRQFVTEPHIRWLAQALPKWVGQVSSGLCHGTRRGAEQGWFAQHLAGEPDIIGTEIADSATQFPRTVQWDFHDANPDWIGRFDFVYSNSWDHAFDPERAFSTWIDQLRPGGAMLLDFTPAHRSAQANVLDPFGIELDPLCRMLDRVAGERGKVRRVIRAGRSPDLMAHVIRFQRG